MISVVLPLVRKIDDTTRPQTAIRYHGPAGERERLKSEVAEKEPDLLVTTYEAYTAEAIWFRKKRWAVVVLDEG